MRARVMFLGGLLLVSCGDKAAGGAGAGGAGAGGAGAGGAGAGGAGAGGAGAGGAGDPGALLAVSLESKVGVLLDDVPAASRDAAAQAILAKPAAFWQARAERQISAMRIRLSYRRYYSLLLGQGIKAQLPLPPKTQWAIALATGGAARQTMDGHDVITVGYEMTSTLLAPVNAPLDSEPALAAVGGTWDEPFVLPVDPELLLARTGYACMREIADSPNAINGESALTYYDDLCEAGDNAIGCHKRTPLPTQSCKDALAGTVGRVDTRLHFERLPWDAQIAERVRVDVPTGAGSDLEVLASGLANHRVTYRFIPEDSCTLAERCVGGPGWRRLIEFDGTVKNVGKRAMHLGAVQGSPLSMHNVFEFSLCHKHNHFRFYGDFSYGGAGALHGDKRAFCLLSTTRYANNETTPLSHQYDTCDFQGIEAGWGDDYFAGLECQWIDVTGLDTSAGPVTAPLTFASNPSQFLCEGTPRLDANDQPTFEPTMYTTDSGAPIDRPMCDFTPGWDANNTASVPVTVPAKGGLVTSPCEHGQLGPKRDCDFTERPVATCTPGGMVRLACTPGAAPEVVRVCEASEALGSGIPCPLADAQANVVIDRAGTAITFPCPAMRSRDERGSQYALYVAPVLEGQGDGGVVCTAM